MNCEIFREMIGSYVDETLEEGRRLFESAQPAASLLFERNPACSSPWLRQRQASPRRLRPAPRR